MHAPKVALADEGGRTTLVADLGHFTLTTDNELADSLSAEERAVYECFQLRWAGGGAAGRWWAGLAGWLAGWRLGLGAAGGCGRRAGGCAALHSQARQCAPRACRRAHTSPPPPNRPSQPPLPTPPAPPCTRLDHVSAYIVDGAFAWPSGHEGAGGGGAGGGSGHARRGSGHDSGLGLALGAHPACCSGPPRARRCAGACCCWSGGHGRRAQPAAELLLAPPLASQPLLPTPHTAGDYLGQGARVVPLLDRAGMGMHLQAAMAPHPRWGAERRRRPRRQRRPAEVLQLQSAQLAGGSAFLGRQARSARCAGPHQAQPLPPPGGTSHLPALRLASPLPTQPRPRPTGTRGCGWPSTRRPSSCTSRPSATSASWRCCSRWPSPAARRPSSWRSRCARPPCSRRAAPRRAAPRPATQLPVCSAGPPPACLAGAG
jgi:hypothetical protein